MIWSDNAVIMLWNIETINDNTKYTFELLSYFALLSPNRKTIRICTYVGRFDGLYYLINPRPNLIPNPNTDPKVTLTLTIPSYMYRF